MFKRVIGRDISWRQRLKRCTKCQETLLTAEMSTSALLALTDHVQTIEEAQQTLAISLLNSQKRELQLDSELKQMHKTVRKASKLLNRELPERRKKRGVA
jgi:hypothetical protein